MLADQTTNLFFDAPPLAVFSVLTDLENRPRIIGGVRRTELRTLPPIAAGTRYREWKSSHTRFLGSAFEVAEFVPTARLTLVRFSYGARLEAAFSLDEENTGTRLHLAVNGRKPTWPGFPIRLAAILLARQWKKQLDGDLADIKRHVGQFADPGWRQGL